MIKITNSKSAFTLIEMLVASTIFAIVVVISAGVFGSSAKMQVNTQSSIHNQELAALINNRIFDDLKSSTGWGKVVGVVDNGNTQKTYKVKGIAFFKLTAIPNMIIPIIIPTTVSEADAVAGAQNVIIGFSGPETATTATIFYYNSGKVYKKVVNPVASLAITAADLWTDPYLGDLSGAEIKTDSSTIQEFKLSGKNYISDPDPSRALIPKNNVQPLINLDLVVADKRQDNILFETKTSFSSRNYIEEID